MSNGILAALKNDLPRKDDQNILTFQYQGYMILVGRNSFSNERLIADHPHKECLWFHAAAARGSHVVLCIAKCPEPSNEVILHAAGIALRNSKSQATTVHVALLRDVFKPEDADIGVWKTSKRESVEVAA